MRILHLLDTMGYAGTEQHVLTLAAAQRRAGGDARVGCRSGSALEQLSHDRGVPAIALFGRRNALAGLLIAKAALRTISPHILHAHNGRTSLAAAILKRSENSGVVVTQHFITPQFAGYRGPKQWLALRVHHWINRSTNQIVAVSQAAKDAMLRRESLADTRVTCIPNGTDPPHISGPISTSTTRDNLDLLDSAIVVGCIARLEKEKRVDLLLRAAPLILARQPEVRFVIVGAGSLLRELKRLAKQLGIANSLVFTGFRNDVPELINCFDVVALPSPAEPFGLVLLEAMALAKPVVAARAGGPLEIVVDGVTGLLVDPANPAALSEGILRLTQDAETRHRFAEAALQRYRDHFTADAMANRTLEVYRSILPETRESEMEAV